MSGRGDIKIQIAMFIAQLKRRQIAGPKDVALATANLLARLISATRWTTANDMIEQIRQVGRELEAAQPHEFTCGTVVRRVLKNLRTVDEAIGGLEETRVGRSEPAAGTMFGLLSVQNSDQNEATRARDQKQAVIEDIMALIDEISNDDLLHKAGLDLINDTDVLLIPSPWSATLLEFLLRAGQKRNISVIVTECYPNGIQAAKNFVERLRSASISAVVIPDAAVYAVIPKVSKVLISARAVLANGGCVSTSGVSLACQAAHLRCPVLMMAGTFKLSVLYPYDVESLIEVGNSGKVIDFADPELMDKLDVVNPLFDYVKPELIDVVVTTDGSYSPNFVYRLVLDNYSTLDQSLG